MRLSAFRFPFASLRVAQSSDREGARFHRWRLLTKIGAKSEDAS
jgi:hypothetical protein